MKTSMASCPSCTTLLPRRAPSEAEISRNWLPWQSRPALAFSSSAPTPLAQPSENAVAAPLKDLPVVMRSGCSRAPLGARQRPVVAGVSLPWPVRQATPVRLPLSLICSERRSPASRRKLAFTSSTGSTRSPMLVPPSGSPPLK